MPARGLFLVPLLAFACPARTDPSNQPTPEVLPKPGDPIEEPIVDPTDPDPERVADAEFVEAHPMPPSEPSVSGFPQYDPRRETTLWGTIRVGEPPVVSKASQTGTWSVDGSRLQASIEAESEEALWFPTDPKGEVGDGLVRARVELAGLLDVAVLFRQQLVGDPPEVLSGYGLSIEGTVVRLFRWDRGMALPMGQEADLGKLGKRKTLEIVVVMVGPQLIANVYDGDTLEHLVTASVHDTTYTLGRTGFRAGAKHDSKSAFIFLSAMDSAKRAAVTPVDPNRRYGVSPPSDATPFGNTRYAWIRAADLSKIPKALRKQFESEVEGAHGDEVLLFLDTVGYERLLRSGVEVLGIDSNAPWSAFDSAFRKRAGQSPKKLGRGFVLDDSYKDPVLVAELLRAYHERYPTITTLVEIGRTHQNRPIWALKISDQASDPDEAAVLLNAAHHGSELLSIEYVLDAIDSLLAGYHRDPRVTKWVDGLEIWCVPLVNVDGNHMFVHESRFAIRKNAYDGNGDGFADPFEGVDLNRNYPFGWGGKGSSDRPMHKWFRGPKPGSEPETQAMMALANAEHFAGVLSFHTFGTEIYSPYGLEGAQNPSPDINRTIGQQLAAAAPEQPNGRLYAVRKGSYPVAGSDQDWHLHEHGSIAFVVEGSHHNATLDVRTEAVIATRPLWQGLLDRVLEGPAIVGHVRDSAGDPVEATVMIAEIKTFEGERWTSRARDGRFDRAVTKSGSYRLVVSAPGRKPVEREVRVGSRRVSVDIVVPDA